MVNEHPRDILPEYRLTCKRTVLPAPAVKSYYSNAFLRPYAKLMPIADLHLTLPSFISPHKGHPVAISFAQPTEITCMPCGQPFSADIWLIADVGERPDLVRHIRKGSLHDLTCSHCGIRIGEADGPLLLFRAGTEPAILFSPAQQTSSEQDQKHIAGLVNLLYERLN